MARPRATASPPTGPDRPCEGVPVSRRPDLDDADLRPGARSAGLLDVHARPGVWTYLARTWATRELAWEQATSQLLASNSRFRLGAAWLVLTPLLNGLTYFLVFGLLLGVSDDIPDYIGFLTIGVFLFQFTAGTMVEVSRSVTTNRRLMQAFAFPRAVLPLSTSIRMGLSNAIALAVMTAVLLAVPPVEVPTAVWAVLPGLWALQWCFAIGLGLIFARLSAAVSDMHNVLGFGVRIWMYVSGVFFDARQSAAGTPLEPFVAANPMTTFLSMSRDAMLYGRAPRLADLVFVVAVTAVVLVVGIVVFWLGEGSYDRD